MAVLVLPPAAVLSFFSFDVLAFMDAEYRDVVICRPDFASPGIGFSFERIAGIAVRFTAGVPVGPGSAGSRDCYPSAWLSR